MNDESIRQQAAMQELFMQISALTNRTIALASELAVRDARWNDLDVVKERLAKLELLKIPENDGKVTQLRADAAEKPRQGG